MAQPTASRRVQPILIALLLLVAMTGCRTSQRLTNPFGAFGPSSPVVLTPTATSADVVAAVNANTAKIQTYQAPSASISMPESAGLPLVQASIAAERPLRFRLRATTSLTGPEIDLGSNDQRFWIWARRNDPPAVYTARHDLWNSSPARGMAPIEPAWLIDAVGLTTLDPNAAYVGPVPHGNGELEIRTQTPGPTGPRQRVLVIDAQTALVLEQHVYEASGELAASVFCNSYRYDQAAGASLPQKIRLKVPSGGLDMTIHTGPITINAPLSDGGQLWSMPQIGDAPTVDLTTGASVPVSQAGPWDLNGVSSTYGQSGQLATQFGERPAPPTPPQAEPMFAAPTDAAPTTSATPVATTPVPGHVPTGFPERALPATNRTVAPSSSPYSNGFVGLPAGGRTLE